jgi:hypothetical protein
LAPILTFTVALLHAGGEQEEIHELGHCGHAASKSSVFDASRRVQKYEFLTEPIFEEPPAKLLLRPCCTQEVVALAATRGFSRVMVLDLGESGIYTALADLA